MTVKACDLRLADVVRYAGDASPWNTMTVESISDNSIVLVRPYIHTANFSCLSGVITYIGTEQVTVRAESKNLDFDLLRTTPLK